MSAAVKTASGTSDLLADAPEHPAWSILLDRATEHGWPIRYQADLHKHDRASLARLDPVAPFVWALCASATILVAPGDRWTDTAGFADTIASYGSWEGKGLPHLYVWTGRRLLEIQRPALEVALLEIKHFRPYAIKGHRCPLGGVGP